MTPPEPPRLRRTPVWFLIVLVALVGAVYAAVPAYRDYHPDSAVCKAIEATAGRDNLPKGCQKPVLPIVLAVAIFAIGVQVANKVGRRP